MDVPSTTNIVDPGWATGLTGVASAAGEGAEVNTPPPDPEAEAAVELVDAVAFLGLPLGLPVFPVLVFEGLMVVAADAAAGLEAAR
jgi:hypothetical protein